MNKLITVFLTALLSCAAFAQGSQVRGKLTESGGDPVIGAIVYYEGTNVSAVTNSKGEYTIEARQGQELTFSCFGLKTQHVTVGKERVINLTMKEDATMLEDAVVVGYGSQKRQEITGAVATVKADEIRQAGKQDVLGSLQGRVAGLNITSQSGEPGSGYSIKIRGNNSINAATTPLFVIDGLQMDINTEEGAKSDLSTASTDPLSFLNPVDILSIEVLKDAASTAIYGARGANGVILITTKQGQSEKGKTSLTFDASFGLTTPCSDIEMLDAQEWINYRFERGDYNSHEYFGKDTDGDGIKDSPKSVAEYNQTPTDWRKVMLRNAFTQNYNLSARAAIGKTQILASLGYLNQQGMIINNGYQKFTAKVKLDHTVNKKVNFGVNVNYVYNQSDGFAASTGGSFNNYGVTQMIYLERPIDILVPGDEEYDVASPYASLYNCVTDETQRKGIDQRIIGGLYFNYRIIPELVWHIYASANVSNATNREFYSSLSRWGHNVNGAATLATTNTSYLSGSTTFTYKKTWKKEHNFEATLGAEINNYVYDYYYQRAYDFAEESLGYFGLAQGTLNLPTQNHSSSGRMSGFARVNYNYRSRYFVSGTVRADASSRFSAGNRVGVFPSLSAGWIISNEKFMRNASKDCLDNLKLRLSIGSSGNDRITTYSNLSTLGKVFYSDASGSQIIGMAGSTIGNSSLKWETTYQSDLGIDLTMFNGRLDFTFDAYYKDTRDMLFRATLPSQTGYFTQWQNIGRVDNKGIEIALKTVNIKKHDFSWSTNITFDMNRNSVVDLGPGVEEMANNVAKGIFKEEPTKLIKGQPIGIIWGYVQDGNYQLSDFDVYFAYSGVKADPSWVTSANYDDFKYVLKDGVTSMNGVSVKPGDRKYKDLDGDGVVNSATDKTVIGNCYPDFTYGIGNTFSWKGFDLYIFFDGVYGRDILNEFKARSTPGEGNSTYMYNVTRESYYGAWRPENGSNTYARLCNSTNCQQPVSTYYVEDGSYFRLKTLSLSYHFPSKILKAAKMQGLRLTFNVDNVWTWTNYGGLDPDVSGTNATFPSIDYLSYPRGRTYQFGIILNF